MPASHAPASREQGRPDDDGRRERETAKQPPIGARVPLLPGGPAPQQEDRRSADPLLRHEQQDRQVEHDPDSREDRKPDERNAKQDRVDVEVGSQTTAYPADQAPTS